VLSIAIGAIALGGHSSKSASAAQPASAVPAAQPLAAEPGLAATPTQPAMAAPPAMAAAPMPGSPMAAAPGAPAMNPTTPGAMPAPNGAALSRPGVVANVPLFGPTPMATLEPAPLGPSPDEIVAAPAAAAQHATEERMDDEDEGKPSSHDEAFADSASKKEKAENADAKAEEVKPWGTGKLHMPVVYRLKLDKPGTAIHGKSEASGFSVVIPGRKVEGSGTAITKRDDRIATVRTKNGGPGAQITFVFRGKVPGYKIRLRKSNVEIFVCSPDGAK
jgi:hypothetical protein